VAEATEPGVDFSGKMLSENLFGTTADLWKVFEDCPAGEVLIEDGKVVSPPYTEIPEPEAPAVPSGCVGSIASTGPVSVVENNPVTPYATFDVSGCQAGETITATVNGNSVALGNGVNQLINGPATTAPGIVDSACALPNIPSGCVSSQLTDMGDASIGGTTQDIMVDVQNF